MDKQATRSALYHRLHWLWPVLASPWVRSGLRLAGWGLVVAYFLFCGLVLALRYAVLPRVGDYQADIEQAASRAIGQQVTIGRIDAGWRGLNPELALSDVRIADAQGRPAFALTRVDSVLSWRTLWRLRPTLALLALEGPVLHVRRDGAGRITIAGVDTEGEADPRIMEWVLEQPHIRIRDAIIVWEDGLRQAPPLILEDLQLGLDNSGRRHRFGISAKPPEGLASRIDIRGDLKGRLDGGLEDLSGRAYVELDYADLAGWRAWVDYPVQLSRGRGALRIWGDWNDGQARATADLALEEVRVRLGGDVPELDLAAMRGRVAGNWREGDWQLEGHQVELTSADGIRVTPTDFRLAWREDTAKHLLAGSATATMVDVGALQRLASHLPLDARSRELLAAHRPEGRIFDLRTTWEGDAERLRRYSLRARFEGLGMLPAGYFPGARGLTGDVDASEREGRLRLEARDAALELPTVFPEPLLAFAELRGNASWKNEGGVLEARLERLEFAGKDAAGAARGTYRFDGSGPGTIDLTASLSRADGTAVWRYMPHVVNEDTRTWLRRSIVAGHATDARLALRGDLRNFPFRDKGTGEFLITAKAHDVRLEYAPGWPAIDGIEADMSFGVGMKIAARQGRILGTAVGPVTAEIPDFEAPEEMLLIKGAVKGPTGEFLKFIDQSPVGEKIDRFTEDMRATGNGHLDLQLDMPLRHVADTRVKGEFQFHNNQVAVVPGLPPVSQVNGRLIVTENSIVAPEITGVVLGGPMRLSIRNEGDRVNVAMSGTANVKEVRKIFDLSLFDHLTGTTPWKGEVKARKKAADFVVESNLAGISSSLPEPFNKTAATAVPLRIEKSLVADAGKGSAPQERLRVSLGKTVEGVLLRREKGDAMVVERGAVGIGEALPRMPDKGVAIAASFTAFDADFWRGALAANGNGAVGGAAAGEAFPISTVSLKAPSLRLFNRDYHGVELSARPREGGWQMALATREAQGDVFWQGAGEGWVQADLKRLHIPSASALEEGGQPLLDSLPGMDVRVADFSLGDKRLGKLELKARNERSFWNLESLSLQNPDGALKGSAQWNNVGNHHTRLNFELTASDLGKLLERLGYGGAVRRGTATLKGDLDWDGPLVEIHYPTLAGRLEVDAAKGQFAKIEPGLGKLLGLLSLQSLPRRLSLDFRDIFSDGFAFDSIEGKLAVKGGVMRTRGNLRIDGPAATVLMKGEADLKQETQDVLVTVQPEIGSALSVGTALVLANPVVGAAAVIANKVLQNPINKIFSFQYHVSGSWNDPKVEKVGQSVQDSQAPGAPPPKEESP